MTATRPPLRTSSTHWPTASGAPEHSSATSAPKPSVASRTASHRVDRREVDDLVAERRPPSRSRRPRPDHDDAAGAERVRALGHEQPHHARARPRRPCPRPVAAAHDGVQRDRRRVEHRGLLVGERVGDREHALDRVHDVVGVRARGVVAVLGVQAVDAEVLADVVAPLDAAPRSSRRRRARCRRRAFPPTSRAPPRPPPPRRRRRTTRGPARAARPSARTPGSGPG